MSKLRGIVAIVLSLAVCGACVDAAAQRRRTPPPPPRTVRRTPPATPAPTVAASRLTGLYRLDIANSDNPRRIAQRAATFALPGERRRIIDGLMARLSSPEQLAIERRGNNITLASTRAPRISFDADGREQVEQGADGRQVRTRAVVYNELLSVSATGSEEDAFSVNFDPIENGRRLRVTRRLFVSELGQEVVVQSLYDKVSSVARWTIYGEPETQLAAARNNQQRPPQGERRRPQTSPPVIVERQPPTQPLPSVDRRDTDVISIQNDTRFIATLDNHLTTAQSREGDRFTMTVREPAQFAGATLEGYVAHVNPSGRISGRPEMRLSFDRLRLRDGRTVAFNGVVEAVRAPAGEDARVDNEGGGSVQESDNQSTRTTQRVAIGAAVGAIIGAIASGGKGAAIGAAIGAGAGAGSVYAQGRDHLELANGTEFTIRASQQ